MERQHAFGGRALQRVSKVRHKTGGSPQEAMPSVPASEGGFVGVWVVAGAFKLGQFSAFRLGSAKVVGETQGGQSFAQVQLSRCR